MNELTYPFLSTLLVPALTDVALTDRHGNAVEVNVDTYQTPYQSFVLLSLHRSRRTPSVHITTVILPATPGGEQPTLAGLGGILWRTRLWFIHLVGTAHRI